MEKLENEGKEAEYAGDYVRGRGQGESQTSTRLMRVMRNCDKQKVVRNRTKCLEVRSADKDDVIHKWSDHKQDRLIYHFS